MGEDKGCVGSLKQFGSSPKNTAKQDMSSTVCFPAMCNSSLFLRSSSLSSSIKGHVPSKVVFHQRLSSIKWCLPSQAVKVKSYKHFFSGNILYTLLKVFFHQRSSSVKGCLPSKVIFCQRLSSFKGRLPSKVVFCLYPRCVLVLYPRFV